MLGMAGGSGANGTGTDDARGRRSSLPPPHGAVVDGALTGGIKIAKAAPRGTCALPDSAAMYQWKYR
jgi:hypothetical protein